MTRHPSKVKLPRVLSRRVQFVALPVMVAISLGVIALAVIVVVLMPTVRDDQRGIGANGFSAFPEKGTDLGIDKVVTKSDVVDVLGEKAKRVSDADVTDVFNLAGIRSQMVTYDFVRTDDVSASIYIDLKTFPNSTTLEKANILKGTAEAGKVGDYDAYFMRAFTFGKKREYYLLLTKGLNAYVFAFVQPSRDILFSEVSAVATLKRLAQKADLL